MFDYYIPQFTDIEIEAENAKEAERNAIALFEDLYPEAVDPTIVKVTPDAA